MPTIEQYQAALELAANDHIFFNYDWWEQDVKDGKRKSVVVPIANVNDTFDYACADGETIPWDEIVGINKKQKSDKWALVRWASSKRGYDPLPEVVEMIKKYDEAKK